MRWAVQINHYVLFAATLFSWSAAHGQQPTVRDYEQNGIRYRETRTIVQQPVRDVRYVDQPQVGYQSYTKTEVRNLVQERLLPTTSYEFVPRLYDWWRVFGIFGEPYVGYSMEPSTRWQRQPVSFAVPTTRQEIVPYARTVKVAVPYLRFEAKEHITTVALSPAASSQVAAAPITPSAANPPPTYVPPDGTVTSVATLPPTYQPLSPPYATPNPNYIPADPYSTNAFPQTFAPALPPSGALVGPTSTVATNSSADGMTFSTRAPIGGAASYRPPLSANENYGNRATGQGYGGVARLTGDPPRYGVSTSGSSIR